MKRGRILTGKQELFVDEYLVDFNGTQAAIRAGYSRKTARAIASENLKKPSIQAEIKRRTRHRKKQSETRAERVIAELTQIAFANFADILDANGDFKDLKDWPPETCAAVLSFRSVERYSGQGENRKMVAKRVSVKMRDKLKALKLLLAYYGMPKAAS